MYFFFFLTTSLFVSHEHCEFCNQQFVPKKSQSYGSNLADTWITMCTSSTLFTSQLCSWFVWFSTFTHLWYVLVGYLRSFLEQGKVQRKQNKDNRGWVSAHAAQLPVLSVAWPAPPSAALPPGAWPPPTAGLSELLPQPFSSPAPAAPWLSSRWPAEKVPELENQRGPLSTETERVLVHKQDLYKRSPLDEASGTDTHGNRRAKL